MPGVEVIPRGKTLICLSGYILTVNSFYFATVRPIGLADNLVMQITWNVDILELPIAWNRLILEVNLVVAHDGKLVRDLLPIVAIIVGS